MLRARWNAEQKRCSAAVYESAPKRARSALEGLQLGVEYCANPLAGQHGRNALGLRRLTDRHVAARRCSQPCSCQLGRHAPCAPLAPWVARVNLQATRLNALPAAVSPVPDDWTLVFLSRASAPAGTGQYQSMLVKGACKGMSGSLWPHRPYVAILTAEYRA